MLQKCAAGLVGLFLFFSVNSQSTYLKVIDPYALDITTAQTTNIIFPFAIQSVDRGSAQVLAQKAKGVNNILQLKAARKGFSQTNVTVVTNDGQFYSFVVHYAEHPLVLNVSIEKKITAATKAQLATQPVARDRLEAMATRIKQLPARLLIGTHDALLRLRLRNIFVDSTSLWFTMRASNFSAVGFHPDIIRFYVKEKRQAKRTAVQEKVMTPLFIDALPTVGKPSPLIFSVAFTPFTIKRSQRFYVQIGERSGARLLTLPIRYKALLKARPAPQR